MCCAYVWGYSLGTEYQCKPTKTLQACSYSSLACVLEELNTSSNTNPPHTWSDLHFIRHSPLQLLDLFYHEYPGAFQGLPHSYMQDLDHEIPDVAKNHSVTLHAIKEPFLMFRMKKFFLTLGDSFAEGIRRSSLASPCRCCFTLPGQKIWFFKNWRFQEKYAVGGLCSHTKICKRRVLTLNVNKVWRSDRVCHGHY